MFCTNCGISNEDNHKFCMACGSKLHKGETMPSPAERPPEQFNEQQPPPVPSKGWLLWISVPVLSLLLLLILLFALPDSHNKPDDVNENEKLVVFGMQDHSETEST
jgi:uncharacterized membrane protein YvbJ